MIVGKNTLIKFNNLFKLNMIKKIMKFQMINNLIKTINEITT